jgi:hypothetical protein
MVSLKDCSKAYPSISGCSNRLEKPVDCVVDQFQQQKHCPSCRSENKMRNHHTRGAVRRVSVDAEAISKVNYQRPAECFAAWWVGELELREKMDPIRVAYEFHLIDIQKGQDPHVLRDSENLT